MTIPQIENELRILHENDIAKNKIIADLQQNISDLRAQLEIARPPQAAECGSSVPYPQDTNVIVSPERTSLFR